MNTTPEVGLLMNNGTDIKITLFTYYIIKIIFKCMKLGIMVVKLGITSFPNFLFLLFYKKYLNNK